MKGIEDNTIITVSCISDEQIRFETRFLVFKTDYVDPFMVTLFDNHDITTIITGKTRQNDIRPKRTPLPAESRTKLPVILQTIALAMK